MEKVVQGDSISRDVTSTTVSNFTGWTGVWGVYTSIGGTALHSDIMTISSDFKKLECRVPPYDGIDALPIGTIYLEMQISNASLNFRRTMPQERIQIVKQSITS